jgi:hypothetical protein
MAIFKLIMRSNETGWTYKREIKEMMQDVYDIISPDSTERPLKKLVTDEWILKDTDGQGRSRYRVNWTHRASIVSLCTFLESSYGSNECLELYYSHGVQYFIRDLYPSLLDTWAITPQEREVITAILPDSPMLFLALNDQSPAQRVLTRFIQELSGFTKVQAYIYPLVISSVYIDHATYETSDKTYQKLISILPDFFDSNLPAIVPAAYTEMQNFHGSQC